MSRDQIFLISNNLGSVFFPFLVTPVIVFPNDPPSIVMAAPAVAQVRTSSPLVAALPRGTTTNEVSSEVISQNKSDEDPNKNGGKKKPRKKRKKVDVEDMDSEDIEVPIDITVNLPESVIKPLPKGLTIDHLHKHLIVQQFKLAEIQTAFFKMMCSVVGPLKMYLNNKSKVQGQTRRDMDHQYHCDDIMN